MQANRMERRLRIAGVVLLMGLVTEVLSLFGKGPVAFLIFTSVCAVLTVAGILLYLHGVLSRTQHPPWDADR